MPARGKLILILILLVLACVPFHTVAADIGPKPTMDFEFVQEAAGDPLSITGGTLFECEQPDCSDAKALEELGPQRFTCEAHSCYALAYGFSPYHRLELQFSDGTARRSNIFKTAGFESKYTVTIREDDLQVEAQFNPQNLVNPVNPRGPRQPAYIFFFICACLCCLVVIAALILVLVLRRRTAKQ